MKTLILVIITLGLALIAAGCKTPKQTAQDDHSGHSGEAHAGHEAHESTPATELLHGAHNAETDEADHHEEAEEHGSHADHAGEKSHSEETHQDHADESEIVVAPEQCKLAGITVAKAETGSIQTTINLSGEIGFNEDKLMHITPRFPGLAKEAPFNVGDNVQSGDVVAVIESNASLTTYSLRSPLAGTVIKKHILPGEHVTETESIYLIADLSTVWVNFAVYPKDAAIIKKGQKIAISVVGSPLTTTGTIHYITPVMDPQTRRITARVVLNNSSGEWRPGTFVNAEVEAGEGEEGIIVEKNAVQILKEKTVIFISDEPNRFKPLEVTTGASDARHIRILGDIKAGMEYVSSGAFELKAKIVTSSLGEHAGHGH